MTTNNAILENIDRAVILLDDLMTKEKNVCKCAYFRNIKDCFCMASALIRRNRLDEAGKYLVTAQRQLKEVC